MTLVARLLQEKLALVLLVICVLTSGIFLVMSLPLFGKVKEEKASYQETQARLDVTQQRLDAYRALGKKIFLIPEDNLSPAMNEMKSQGKELGVRFVSTKTGEAFTDGNQPYRIIPVQMELTGSFPAFGNFLGAMDDLEQSLITVKSFEVQRDTDNPLNMKAHLVLHIYVYP